MNNPMAETVRELERAWPSFQVWYVPRAVGPTSWHARRWHAGPTPANTLHADSPEALTALLEAEAGK